MNKLVECVPNISEGNDLDVINKIVARIITVRLQDQMFWNQNL